MKKSDACTCLVVVNLVPPGNCLPQPMDLGSVLTLTGSLSSPRHTSYNQPLEKEKTLLQKHSITKYSKTQNSKASAMKANIELGTIHKALIRVKVFS